MELEIMSCVISFPIPVPIPIPMPRFQCRGLQMADSLYLLKFQIDMNYVISLIFEHDYLVWSIYQLLFILAVRHFPCL